MIEEDGTTRCEHCGEIIPDMILWVETHGMYKSRKKYRNFRWDFCDLFCLRDYLQSDKLDWDGLEMAKHKTAKDKVRRK